MKIEDIKIGQIIICSNEVQWNCKGMQGEVVYIDDEAGEDEFTIVCKFPNDNWFFLNHKDVTPCHYAIAIATGLTHEAAVKYAEAQEREAVSVDHLNVR